MGGDVSEDQLQYRATLSKNIFRIRSGKVDKIARSRPARVHTASRDVTDKSKHPASRSLALVYGYESTYQSSNGYLEHMTIKQIFFHRRAVQNHRI